jgi:tetratricopeptide (TPR) repeat protein
VDPAVLGKAARLRAFEVEKLKGNECIKTGGFMEAIGFYSKALALVAVEAAAGAGEELCPRDGIAASAASATAAETDARRASIVLGNRSHAHFLCRNYGAAEEDADAAIALDAGYPKAWVRRGNARSKRGRHAGAWADYHRAVSLAPSFAVEGAKLMDAARAAHRQAEGCPLDEAAALGQAQAAGSQGQAPKQAPKAAAAIAPPPSVRGKKIIIEEQEDGEEEDAGGRRDEPAPASASRAVASVNRVGETSAAAATAAKQVAPPPARSAAAAPEADDPLLSPAKALKDQGNVLFAQGAYADADVAYTAALAALSALAPTADSARCRSAALLRAQVCSNRCACRMKMAIPAEAGRSASPSSLLDRAITDATDCLAAISLGASDIKTAAHAYASAASDSSLASYLPPVLPSESKPDAKAASAAALTKLDEDRATLSLACKALHRRASGYRQKGSLSDALRDIAAALFLEPGMARLEADLRECKLLMHRLFDIPTSSAGGVLETPPIDVPRATLPSPKAAPPSKSAQNAPAPVLPPRLPQPTERQQSAVSTSAEEKSHEHPAPSTRASPQKTADPTAVPKSPGALQTAPKTALEFESMCSSCKKNPKALFSRLRALYADPAVVGRLFHRPIEPDIASIAVVALTDAATDEAGASWCLGFLETLASLPSFDTTAMLMDSDACSALADTILPACERALPGVRERSASLRKRFGA